MGLLFEKLVEAYKDAKASGLATVIATVVDNGGMQGLNNGSRILLFEDGEYLSPWGKDLMETLTDEAASVFRTGIAKMVCYDDYPSECSFILLEKFQPEEAFLNDFARQQEKQKNFDVISFFQKAEGEKYGLRSIISLEEGIYTFAGKPLVIDNSQLRIYKQELSF